MGSHWADVPTITPRYWTDPPESARLLKADPALIRMMGIAEKSAGEPGYASEAIDFLAVRDTLDWSLPPVWGLLTSTGETPLISRRIVGFTQHARFEWGRWDLESVTHVVTGLNTRIGLGQPIRAGAALIYRNPSAFPRARIVGRPYCANEEAAIEALQQLGPAIRGRLIIEDPSMPLDPKTAASGTARITIDLPEHVEVETKRLHARRILCAGGHV